MKVKMKLNIQAPINSLSYGLVSQNILDNLSCDYTLKPIGHFDPQEYSRFIPKINEYINLNINDPSFRIFHEHSIFDHIGKGPRIAFPIFEKSRFNVYEEFNIKHQDLVIVCSKWAAEIVEFINPNVVVAPLGINPGYIPYQNFNHPDSKVIFYTQGKREVRKGHDYLHKVFNKAFENNNDVELWMFTHNVFDSPEETRNFHNEYKSLLGDKVKFFPGLPFGEMVSWLQRTDCGIFLSRAEGWNMCLHEAMAMGKDVVATYYSGHTEFLDDGIKPLKFCEAFDGKWFHGEFEWMEIEANEEEIVERLRNMYSYKKQLRVINENNARLANKFTWKNTAEKIINGIQRM